MVHAAYIRECEQWRREYLEQAIIGFSREPIVLILLGGAKIAKTIVLSYTSTLMTCKISIFHGLCLEGLVVNHD